MFLFFFAGMKSASFYILRCHLVIWLNLLFLIVSFILFFLCFIAFSGVSCKKSDDSRHTCLIPIFTLFVYLKENHRQTGVFLLLISSFDVCNSWVGPDWSQALDLCWCTTGVALSKLSCHLMPVPSQKAGAATEDELSFSHCCSDVGCEPSRLYLTIMSIPAPWFLYGKYSVLYY